MFDSFRRNKHDRQDNNNPPVNYNSRPDQAIFSTPNSYGSNKSVAPRVHNVNNHDVVHTRLLILEGTAGPVIDGSNSSIIVYHHIDSFPSLRYQVSDGYFKALVHLNPGINNLRIVWEDPQNPNNIITSELSLNYVPLLQNPPLHFALIVAKDSPFNFDSPQYKKEEEGGCGLELAVKKVRLASYMMAAYTSEQMRRGGYGHRTFRIHEEYDKDTLSSRDKSNRSTTKVHIIKSEMTVDEIRDPNRAQQNHSGSDTGALFGIALDAIRKHGGPFEYSGENVMVAALFLDCHWDVEKKLIVGHAALGGGSGHIRLGIFGSHALWSFPSCLEKITDCFLDETRIDTSQVAKDADGEGTAWEVLNVGFGAWLHEIGHLLGCPHEPYGIMLRDWYMNRAFMSREGYASGPKTLGKRPLRPQDDSVWHPLDLIRFRFHPAFRSPFENRVTPSKVTFFPLENGVMVRTMTGVYLVELYIDDQLRGTIMYSSPEQEMFLFEDDLMQQIEPAHRDPTKPLKIKVLVVGEEEETIDDFRELAHADQIHDTFYRNQGVVTGFRSNPMGGNQGEVQTAVFPPNIRGVCVKAGARVDAIEFIVDNGPRPRIGGDGGGANDFLFEPGEYLVGFYVRSGAWVDAVQVITNRRRSPIYGNASGGNGADLVPPAGYEVVGIKGHINCWLISLSVIYVSKN